MTVFAALAFALGFVALAPQLVRVLTGSGDGVSSVTWTLIAAVNWSWAAFFASHAESALAVGNAFLAVSALVVAFRVSTAPRTLISVAAVVAVGVPALHAVAPTVAALFTALGCACMFAPQTYVAVTSAAAGVTLRGVSAVTWVCNVVVSLLWVAAGRDMGHVEVVASNSVLAACSATIVGALFFRRSLPVPTP
jgi:hypothetical protein